MRDFTTAVIQHNFFHLDDSHTKVRVIHMWGLSNADGNSVLLKSASLLKVDSHIKVVYLEYRDIRQSFF